LAKLVEGQSITKKTIAPNLLLQWESGPEKLYTQRGKGSNSCYENPKENLD